MGPNQVDGKKKKAAAAHVLVERTELLLMSVVCMYSYFCNSDRISSASFLSHFTSNTEVFPWLSHENHF